MYPNPKLRPTSGVVFPYYFDAIKSFLISSLLSQNKIIYRTHLWYYSSKSIGLLVDVRLSRSLHHSVITDFIIVSFDSCPMWDEPSGLVVSGIASLASCLERIWRI